MRVRDNVSSLISWRAFSSADNRLSRSLRHLSSGLRVNSAADDAAGLAISQRFVGQFRGLMQANRNALDGVSLINTVEGALGEMHSMLQRARELSVQAINDTLTTSERTSINVEVQHILAEISKISERTSFNGVNLLNPSGVSEAVANVLEGLRGGWLEQTERLIKTWYGIEGDLTTLEISLESSGTTPAWITGTTGTGGKLENIVLHINLEDFGSVGGSDGGTGPVYNDRKVAYALAQAILARNSDFASLPQWFISGVADYIAGGDEALAADVAQYGSATVINAISSWSEDSLHRSSAYLAIKYLASELTPWWTFEEFIAELTASNDLDTALLNTIGTDVAGFLANYTGGGGAALLPPSPTALDLTDDDVGGIGGGDASGVIPNGGTYTLTPLSTFDVRWPSGVDGVPTTTNITLQIGANQGQTVTLEIPEVTRLTLGLLGIDMINDPERALNLFGSAISQVSAVRAYLGAISNRLEHTVSANNNGTENQVASYSRIVDIDFAQEMTHMVRGQIMVASASATLAQANTVRQHVMWLLKELNNFATPKAQPQGERPSNKPTLLMGTT